ncbi:NnrU family protein [Sphingomonas mollis]|uniref:MFS transporter n=1 Tax=Sphingomonas mollis TaxID=2795726 RepID=A0ABS0XUD7_9SPHN|nr:NnrU family protein [Sphingomonas sp. BT553]MBJ6123655.1 MFS transporter [Sphingomonas sp. BT553]
MDGAIWVLAGAASFVGTHFAMSHPLRRPLVARLGETGFTGLYSLVSFLTLGLTIWAYVAAPVTAPAWLVGDVLWGIATALMLVVSILLMGSLVRNPALPGAAKQAATAEAHGVYGITRHPMLWSFAIWGGSHILVLPIAKNIVLSGAIIFLSLVGAIFQDRKKAQLDPQGWSAWQSRTSYLPFAAIVQGRARFGGFGFHAILGGIVVWLAATWAHMPLAGWPAGIWRWVG